MDFFYSHELSVRVKIPRSLLSMKPKEVQRVQRLKLHEYRNQDEPKKTKRIMIVLISESQTYISPYLICYLKN